MDNRNIIKCESCGNTYSSGKSKCPYCGAKRPATAKRTGITSNSRTIGGAVILAIIVIAAVIVVVFSIKHQSDLPEATTSPSDSSGITELTSPPEGTEETAPVTNDIPVESIAIDNTGFQLPVGAMYELKAILTPAEAESIITWSSDNEAIATVNPVSGLVTAVAPGEVHFTATTGDKFAVATVTVYDPNLPASGGTSSGAAGGNAGGGTVQGGTGLSHSDVTIKASSKEKFTLKFNGSTDWVYYSSDTNVATVDEKGVVTAVAKGTCKVTVTANGSSYSCTVRVR
ncbi:MAG: Ig-like domain-containing protein [Oscillospiraceae bacterium]|nr:Ig-like domain-containing protein [Oscillospiraceae bacterium]